MDTDGEVSRAFLVGIDRIGAGKTASAAWPVDASLRELALLARTAGLVVAGASSQRLRAPDSATYVGSGKLREIVAVSDELGASTIVFDDELAPGQIRNIERAFDGEVKILDRTSLILDIFSQHARTREGRLQVHLAQYRYRLPRLTRMWTHLARQAGGRSGGSAGVGLRGPGETQIETDRREIRRRISHLETLLESVRGHRRHARRRRRRREIPVVALVGYTNAGKSSLLNALAGSDVSTRNKLFETLDPTTRRIQLPKGKSVLLSDTVGFIQKLPHSVVAAFRATMEEIVEADVVVLVADASDPLVGAHIAAVQATLREIGMDGCTVLRAWNKIDRLSDDDLGPSMERGDVRVSARRGDGLDILLERIEEELRSTMEAVEILVPYDRGDLVHEIHRIGTIDSEEHLDEGTRIRAHVPEALAQKLRRTLGLSESVISGTT